MNYRKIKCSERYPTKETRYFVKTKTGRRTTLPWSKATEHVWFKEVDSYLVPFDLPTEGEIKHEIAGMCISDASADAAAKAITKLLKGERFNHQ